MHYNFIIFQHSYQIYYQPFYHLFKL